MTEGTFTVPDRNAAVAKYKGLVSEAINIQVTMAKLMDVTSEHAAALLQDDLDDSAMRIVDWMARWTEESSKYGPTGYEAGLAHRDRIVAFARTLDVRSDDLPWLVLAAFGVIEKEEFPPWAAKSQSARDLVKRKRRL